MDQKGIIPLMEKLDVRGSNDQIMKPKIFEQEQIARAAQIGLGASSPAEIDLFPADDQSREFRDRVAEALNGG
jgi:hypothetical protein